MEKKNPACFSQPCFSQTVIYFWLKKERNEHLALQGSKYFIRKCSFWKWSNSLHYQVLVHFIYIHNILIEQALCFCHLSHQPKVMSVWNSPHECLTRHPSFTTQSSFCCAGIQTHREFLTFSVNFFQYFRESCVPASFTQSGLQPRVRKVSKLTLRLTHFSTLNLSFSLLCHFSLPPCCSPPSLCAS